MLRKWWELWPGRLEYELEALRLAGIRCELDKAALEGGRVIIRVWPTVEGQTLGLVAVFPDLYPYFRFELLAQELDLPRHQHPFGKNLCLIGRATQNWKTTDTLAVSITERLPKVLVAGRGDAQGGDTTLEEPQGEPFSDYYSYQKDAAVLVDSGWVLPDKIRTGECTIGVWRLGALIRGAVLRLDGKAQTLYQVSQNIAALFTHSLSGRWVRVNQPIHENHPHHILQILAGEFPALMEPTWNRVNDGRVDVVAVAFPEEVRWHEQGTGWLFVVRYQNRGDRKTTHAYLARAIRAGESDLAARVPLLRPLRERTIAVFGAGALGAPSVFEMARSGVGEIRVLDHDFVDAATTVRWLLGLQAVGLQKAEVLQRFVEANYPHTRIRPFVHRLGGAAESGPSDLEVLAAILDGADIIYDATAELGIQHLLSDLALKCGIPYIAVSSTSGAWGGLLLRVRPGRTAGCWSCVQNALQDGTIPAPPSDRAGQFQPAGCADPTFTGAGFDLAQIALAGVRLAVGTLCEGADGGYPNVSWDVAVIALRDEQGGVIPARWTTFSLGRHPECQACTERSALPG